MCDADEFDELEIETIATVHLFDDETDCSDLEQTGEFSDCKTVANHYHNSGCGCLTLILPTVLLAITAVLLVLAF